MEFLVSKVNRDSAADEVVWEKPRVVIADTAEEAQSRYKMGTHMEITEDSDLLCVPVNSGSANLDLEAYSYKRVYPDEIECISVKDLKSGKIYQGFAIDKIPAGEKPTEETILKCYYRGNVDAYNSDYERAKEDVVLREKIRRWRIAIPWDRIVIDDNYSNVVIPLSSNFEIL